ncbi:MAG: hypothetical protein GYA55_10635, partial [SAR324 cluster bacterium]|nr:hypothetical protein [SAR324 cluster bacterium]
GTKRPNYYTYRKFAELVGNFVSVQEIKAEDSKYIYKYMLPDGSAVYVLWAELADGSTFTISDLGSVTQVEKICTVPDLNPDDTVILDSSGNPTFETSTEAVSGGSVTISTTSNVPYYVIPK